MIENRRNPRVSREAVLTVTKLQYPMINLESKPALTKNLAENGLCFRTDEPYETGTVLQLAVELKGWQHYLQTISALVDAGAASKPLTAVAEVVWSREAGPEEGGYDVGVHFKDIYEDDLLAFKKYLERLLNQHG